MPLVDLRPLLGLESCVVTGPAAMDDRFDPVDGFLKLLIAERAELEAELGCPVRFASETPLTGAGKCLIGPASRNPALRTWLESLGREPATEPLVRIDRARRVVAIDGPTIDDVGDAFQLLRTAIRLGADEYRTDVPQSPDDVLRTIQQEVAETYPSFGLRGLEWAEISERHRAALRSSGASLPAMQRLFAELQDAHTWVRDLHTNARLPYRAWIEPERSWLTHVPRWSAAWAVGVRAGDVLLDVDGRDWWERTAAAPRTRPAVVGYRWLAGKAGAERTLRVRRPNGEIVLWSERYEAVPWREPISATVLTSGTGHLRIRGWQFTRDWVVALDRAFGVVGDCPRLIVDLRGNVGGQLIAAQHFRDRFLTGPTTLGAIRFSIGGGRLSDPAPIVGTSPESGPRWWKPVRFLVDRQTYSASEDAILGLGQLSNVQIVGEPTGGGSGRPRTIQLAPNIAASISTALTFDLTGHCVEANGIPVDLALPINAGFRDPAAHPASAILAQADLRW